MTRPENLNPTTKRKLSVMIAEMGAAFIGE